MKVTYPDDLDTLLTTASALISRGVADRRSGFHTLQVATLGLDGAPKIRTVVLRAYDAATRTLRFHTDRRSPKVAEITRDPRVALHFYDAPSALQLRIDAMATVKAETPAAVEAWDKTRPFSRICYRVERAPGDPIEAPVEGFPPRDGEEQDGRDAFSIVQCRLIRLEWLHLSHDGHRRAAFHFLPTGIISQWLVP
jgi:pyridoxamine 5'-phosphate oxidase